MSGNQPRKWASICAWATFHAGVSENPMYRTFAGYEIVQGAHRLLNRREGVPGMLPVQIDIVGLQPSQRLLAGLDNCFGTATTAIWITRIHVEDKLRC